jgi:hypothetical protein
VKRRSTILSTECSFWTQRDKKDAAAIFAIVFLNTVQEFRAEKSNHGFEEDVGAVGDCSP